MHYMNACTCFCSLCKNTASYYQVNLKEKFDISGTTFIPFVELDIYSTTDIHVY